MLLTSSFLATSVVLILSMLCLGLWANTYKMAGNWRFELYYLDFAVGALITALIAALTLGTLGFDGFSFVDDVLHAGKKQDVMGVAAGIVFNVGNILLVGGISIAGMSIAFPLAFGLAISLGALWSFASHPGGSAAILFAGVAIALLATICGAYTYRQYKLSKVDELVKSGKVKSTRRTVSMKGVIVSLISGVFLGSFGPLLEKCQSGDSGLGPYSVDFVLAAGVMLSTVLLSLFLMNLPIDGPPLELPDYFRGTLGQHGLGLLGGIIWCSGMLGFLVASHAEGAAIVPPAFVFGAAQVSVVIAALCGLVLWREFRDSEGKIRALLVVMLALFIGGVAMISVAPTWVRI